MEVPVSLNPILALRLPVAFLNYPRSRLTRKPDKWVLAGYLSDYPTCQELTPTALLRLQGLAGWKTFWSDKFLVLRP